MRTLHRLAAVLALVLVTTAFIHGGAARAAETAPVVAAADPTADALGLNAASMIALILLTVASVVVRKLAPTASFLHTAWGAALLSFLSAAFTFLAQAWQANGVSLKSTLPALFAAVTSWAASDNPSMPAGEVSRMARMARSKSRGSARLGLMMALALTACGTAGGAALLRCEIGALPQTLQSVIAAVTAIASQSTNAVPDLVAFGTQVAPQQIDCVAQALLANATPPHGAGAVQQPVWLVRLRANLGDYLAMRKSQGASLQCDPALLERINHETPLWVGGGPAVAQTVEDCRCGDLACVRRVVDQQIYHGAWTVTAGAGVESRTGSVSWEIENFPGSRGFSLEVASSRGRYLSWLAGPNLVQVEGVR